MGREPRGPPLKRFLFEWDYSRGCRVPHSSGFCLSGIRKEIPGAPLKRFLLEWDQKRNPWPAKCGDVREVPLSSLTCNVFNFLNYPFSSLLKHRHLTHVGGCRLAFPPASHP